MHPPQYMLPRWGLGGRLYDGVVRIVLLVVGMILILLGLGLAFTIFGLASILLGVVAIAVGMVMLGGRATGRNAD
jgi:hypothetical protein